MYDIITCGGAVLDAFLYTGLPEIHGKMCYPAGAKLEVEDLRFFTGGAGTNCAVSFSRLGLKTGAFIKLGYDTNAQVILKELKENHVHFLGTQAKGLTDFSAILDSREHERTVLTYKHQSNSLTMKDIRLKQTRWFYFSALDDVALHTQIQLLKKNNARLAYNPSSYLTMKGPSKIRPLLEAADILILNDSEARDLVPKGDLFEGLHKFGPEIVCITFGKKGNTVSDGKHRLSSLPRKIKVSERTGAGDAFASGFVSGMILHNDIRKAMIMGSLNAESVIQIAGAKNGLLTKKEMDRQLSKNLIKIVEGDL